VTGEELEYQYKRNSPNTSKTSLTQTRTGHSRASMVALAASAIHRDNLVFFSAVSNALLHLVSELALRSARPEDGL